MSNIEGMSVRQVALNAKWLYIFSMQGVKLEATNNELMSIPSGFFAFSRDELQQYFSNNYVTIHYYNSDTYFDVFCYDFTINSVNPLSDNVTPAILNFSSQMSQQLNQLITMVNSINSGVNLIALNSGATDVDLGTVFAVFDTVKNCFAVYGIPDNLNSFHGVVRFSGSVSIAGRVDGRGSTFDSDSSVLVPSGECGAVGLDLLSISDDFEISLPLRFFKTDGSEVLGLNLSSPVIPSFNFDISCFYDKLVGGMTFYKYSLNSSYFESVSFSDSTFVFSGVTSQTYDMSNSIVSNPVGSVISFSIPSDVAISFSISGS